MVGIQGRVQNPRRISRINFFSRLEAAELPKLLMPDEQVLAVLSGFYTAGTAILCVTSKRLLLIDKKLIRLNFEDIRFESISELNYSHQVLVASLKLFYTGRVLQFRTWYKQDLRVLAQFVQNKMFEARDGSNKQPQQWNIENGDRRQLLPAEPATSVAPTPIFSDQHLDKYIDRTTRWRRAGTFIDIANSTKLGRQILNLEAKR